MADDHVKDAAEAHTTLCLIDAAARILEGSDIRGQRAQDAANKAVKILRREQAMLLRDYDRARAKAKRSGGNDANS